LSKRNAEKASSKRSPFWRDAGIAVNSAAGSSTLTVECNQSRLGRERRGAGFSIMAGIIPRSPGRLSRQTRL